MARSNFRARVGEPFKTIAASAIALFSIACAGEPTQTPTENATTGGRGSSNGGVATSAGQGGTEPATGGASGNGGNPPVSAIPFSSYVPVGAPIALSGVVNASDIAWKASTDTFFLLLDRVAEFREYGPDFGAPVRIIQIVNGPVDAEGLTYLGPFGNVDRFALAVEATADEVLVFDLAPSATSIDMRQAVLQTYVPAAAPAIANKGWEGVGYRPAAAGGVPARLYACQEGEPGQAPIRVLSFPYQPDRGPALSYEDGSLLIDEAWNAANKLGNVAGDLSGLFYDRESETLLLLSHLGSRLLRVDPATGDIRDQLLLARSPQYEGVTLTSDGRLVLVSEPNFVEIFRRPGG